MGRIGEGGCEGEHTFKFTHFLLKHKKFCRIHESFFGSEVCALAVGGVGMYHQPRSTSQDDACLWFKSTTVDIALAPWSCVSASARLTCKGQFFSKVCFFSFLIKLKLPPLGNQQHLA
jgi:hypothetical protein